MKLLLDTHAFLWLLDAREKLSDKVIAAHNDPSTALYLSMVSVWEIQINVLAAN